LKIIIKPLTMKRVFKYLALIILAGSVPLTMSFGQENKSEKKIKVVIDDGSGARTVLDTTFSDGTLPETINLKDWKVVFIGEPDKGIPNVKPDAGTRNVIVTVTSDDKGEKKEEKRIFVISSDSVKWTEKQTEKGKNVYVYTTTESTGGKSGSKVVVSATGSDKSLLEEEDGNQVIVIKDGKMIRSEGGESFNIKVESDDVDSDMETTKYVIAKDGLVITVEGSDEARAKEILKVIESKLDIKSDGGIKKEVVKEETKKIVKK
jgi:hypothetical protein